MVRATSTLAWVAVCVNDNARRGWATSRKHLSLKDNAAAGGWASTETLLRCYQQPDADTMLAVVMRGADLRERKVL